MTVQAIRGGIVHIDGRWIRADVTIDGSTISSIDTERVVRSAGCLDATGCRVVPGFVDLQVNGAVGVDLTTEPERIGEVAAFLVGCGVTSFMPTVISSSATRVAAAVAAVNAWSLEEASGARSLGVHLEGPFLNPARAGAHPLHRLRHLSVDEVRGWRQDAGYAMVTLAPELPHALDVIEQLVANGVAVCAGHTDASQAEMNAAVVAGMSGVTHLFNAMTPMSARVPGPAGTTLAGATLIAGLIVDGVHVDPAMVRLAWQALGPNRIALVSDAISALGVGDGQYRVGDTHMTVDGNSVRTGDGTIAGSVLRLDDAVRNLMAFTGCGLADASISVSATPARLAKRPDIGRIEPGCAADVALLDENNRVVATVVGGRAMFDPQQRCTGP
ncbi:MAG: N-acetylglucosamine-6-phosphate deacetylase [Ilumatobacteraceae bacterium]